jgi:hypothetical protein
MSSTGSRSVRARERTAITERIRARGMRRGTSARPPVAERGPSCRAGVSALPEPIADQKATPKGTFALRLADVTRLAGAVREMLTELVAIAGEEAVLREQCDEIGERLQAPSKIDRELPASLRMQIDRLRRIEGLSQPNVVRSTLHRRAHAHPRYAGSGNAACGAQMKEAAN